MENEFIRKIKEVIKGDMTSDGAGVKLRRVFGHPHIPKFDPFLMLDAFDSENPEDYTKGFPWHPHRGIETVTYLIEGNIEHGDSLGNKGFIKDGQCQWMTAGSGIIHQEMPKEASHMYGFQLWVNLPKEDKMTEPKYRDISLEEIPVFNELGKIVKIISGSYEDLEGPLKGIATEPLFLDIELLSDTVFELKTDKNKRMFAYIFEGSGRFSPEAETENKTGEAVLFGFGESVVIKAGHLGVRLVLIAGNPLNEPVAWGGPIVMNTKEELQTAFQELDEGTFIK